MVTPAYRLNASNTTATDSLEGVEREEAKLPVIRQTGRVEEPRLGHRPQLSRGCDELDVVAGELLPAVLEGEAFGREPQRRLAPCFSPDGFVYLLGGFVGREGFYKIGRTVDPKTRIRQLGIQLPFPVSVEPIIPCEDHKASVLALHDLHKDKRVNGEWFRLLKADVEEIKSIRRMRGAEAEKDEQKGR